MKQIIFVVGIVAAGVVVALLCFGGGWNTIGMIGSLVTLLVAAPVFITWWEIGLGHQRRQKKWFEEMKKLPGKKPVILIVNLLRTEQPTGSTVPESPQMKPDVFTFVRNDANLKTLNLEEMEKNGRILEVAFNVPEIKAEQVPELANRFAHASSRIVGSACDVLHVFYGGPGTPALILGAILGNRHSARLYQQNPKTKTYEYWGPLQY